jgi:signal transduction histidine kinase
MQLEAVKLGVRVSMMNISNRLFCRLDGFTPMMREQKRIALLKSLGLLEDGTVPVFEEATQTAAHFIDTPICILGVMVEEELWLKSAIGLSRLGLMNQLASSRRIPRMESFCTHVVDSQQLLLIEDTYEDPLFAQSLLTQYYGIRAYMGTPLITAEGGCIGTLAVMDLVSRHFSQRDAEFLGLTARWCLREFERDLLLKQQASSENQGLLFNLPSARGYTSFDRASELSTDTSTSLPTSTQGIKLQFLSQLTQELRAPLTSVVGMASVLLGETFGPLNNKQKEYLEIIHTSGKQMNGLVDEVLKLGAVDNSTSDLNLTPVNLEMLCQQALTSLAKIAKHKRQELRLSLEPGQRIWLLDKEKAQQALYYLAIGIIESSEPGSEIRIHVSRKNKTLNIAVWVFHPWLEGGLPQVKLQTPAILNSFGINIETEQKSQFSEGIETSFNNYVLSSASLELALNRPQKLNEVPAENNNQELLGLLLACYLAESHGGQITVQGSSESGYRYVLILPKIEVGEQI